MEFIIVNVNATTSFPLLLGEGTSGKSLYPQLMEIFQIMEKKK